MSFVCQRGKMLKRSLLKSALVSSVERSLRRIRNPKILKRFSRLPQRPSKMFRRASFSGRVTKTFSASLPAGQHLKAKMTRGDVLRKKKYFDEDHSDFELSDEDSDFEEDDPERNYTKRAIHEKGQKFIETFYHSDDSQDSDDSEDSEDEERMEMEIEMLEEELKRMDQIFELHSKDMDENEIRDFRQRFVMKKRQLGALEQMLETKYMMEKEEMEGEMKRELEEDLKRMGETFERDGRFMDEIEIQDLEQRYAMKKSQLMELEEMLEMRGMMEEEGKEMKRGREMKSPVEMENFGQSREIDVMEEMEMVKEKEMMEYLDNMNETGDMERFDLEPPVDLLQKHIGDHDLGLVFRPPTRYK